MTNYEKICAYIHAGHYAVCEGERYVYIVTGINNTGVRCGLGSTIQSAMEELGGYCYKQGFIDSKNFTRIYPLPRPIPKYKVGDKVVVLDNIKEIMLGHRLAAGEVCKVTGDIDYNGGMCIVKENGDTWFVLPHCVAPYFEDEAEEMTVEQICKALGKNIKIVK